MQLHCTAQQTSGFRRQKLLGKKWFFYLKFSAEFTKLNPNISKQRKCLKLIWWGKTHRCIFRRLRANNQFSNLKGHPKECSFVIFWLMFSSKSKKITLKATFRVTLFLLSVTTRTVFYNFIKTAGNFALSFWCAEAN